MARLTDGHGTTITFSSGSLTIYEKSVTPPAISGGGANDTTTMRNTEWRTKAPKQLKSLTQAEFEAAYNTEIYDQIVDHINVNQQITVTFPDGSELEFWGWLDEFKPQELKEGEQPTAMVTVQCSNQDNDGNEVAPVYTGV